MLTGIIDERDVRPWQIFFLVFVLFKFKQLLIELLLESLIRVIDTKLLHAIRAEEFEAVYI